MVHSLRVRLLLTLIVVVFVAVGTVALLASRVTASELQRYVDLDLQRNQRVIDTLAQFYRRERGGGDAQALARQMQQSFDERVILTDGAGRIQADSQNELVGQLLDCGAPIAEIIVSVGSPSCLDQPIAGPTGLVQDTTIAGVTSDVLFWSMPVSQSSSMPAAPAGAAVHRSELLTLGAGESVPAEVVLGVGARQPSGAELPGISIRRTRGQAGDPIQAGFIGAVNRSLLLGAGAAGLVALLLTALLSRRILGPIEALTAAARAMQQGDLSQRVPVRSRDEIGALAHSFNNMADGLARIERLRRQMVSDVAHELRTPLTNIRGYLEALRDGVAAPTPELIGSLHDEALLLNRLVNDLQDLALAEAGQLRLDRRPTALAPVVEQAVGALGPMLAEKHLSVDVDLPADLPDADADAERVGQVLRNLLANAVTHTPSGGNISIAASFIADCRLQVADWVVGQSAILVQVCDSGAGIAPEHLELVFERFFRADRSRARATGGAGLGLAIVRQLVEAHGGRVWAESPPGRGATFSFTLPAG
jgi:signal transduction histidine kinase